MRPPLHLIKYPRSQSGSEGEKSIMGMIICLFYISYIWRKYYAPDKSIDGYFNYMTLQSITVLEREFPSDIGFWSLRWSVIRRFVITIIIALLIYFVNNFILNTILLWFNLIFVGIITWFQIFRFRKYRRSGSSATFLQPVVHACIATAVYAIFTQISLYTVYGLRP